VPVAVPLVAHARGLRRAERDLQLFLDEPFDRVADPQPHHRLDRVRPERDRFRCRRDLGIAVHGVILRPPAAKRERAVVGINCAG